MLRKTEKNKKGKKWQKSKHNDQILKMQYKQNDKKVKKEKIKITIKKEK